MLSLIRVPRLFNRQVFKDLLPLRHGSYLNPKTVSEDLSKYTDYEVSKDPKEWKFVEDLLPKKIIPPPKYEENLPSGYKPATVKPGEYSTLCCSMKFYLRYFLYFRILVSVSWFIL